MAVRLPTHLEIGAILRITRDSGGFATVLAKGDRDAGTILIVSTYRGGEGIIWERLPSLDDTHSFVPIDGQALGSPQDLVDYIGRRTRRDPDLWVIEIEIDDAARFIADRVNRVDRR